MGVNHLGSSGLEQRIAGLQRDLRRVARATLQNSSIGRAGLRVYDGGWIRIEDGGLQVTGTASVSGRLEGDGTFDWLGPVNLKGAQSVTGPSTFIGQMIVNGPWDLNGNGSITGDVAVKSGGEIRVQGAGGDVVLSSTYGSPRINLGGAQIDGGTSFTVTVGSTTVYFAEGTIRIAGMPTVSQASYPGSFPGAVVADTSGKLYRVAGG